MTFDSLGDRMKRYESASRTVLPPRMPTIIRVDGKAFHTWTRGMQRPFDERLIGWMNDVALTLCHEIQGAQLAYIQSDEISILLHDYKRFESQAWFDKQVQKMVSVAAAIAASRMTYLATESKWRREAYFDARAWVLPETEVTNYFLWRQNDAVRNSIQMLARSLYSHAECENKCQAELLEMCWQKGQNWNDLKTHLKRGRCTVRCDDWYWRIDNEIPIWKAEGREYIERLLATEDA